MPNYTPIWSAGMRTHSTARWAPPSAIMDSMVEEVVAPGVEESKAAGYNSTVPGWWASTRVAESERLAVEHH